MKLLHTEFSINWTEPNDSEEYARFNPSLSWIGEEVDGKAKQVLRWTACREILTSQLWKDIVGKNGKICADHTRLALKSVYSKTSSIFKYKGIFRSSDKAMKTAMNMLNVIEEKAGWDLTVITKSGKKTIKNYNNDKVIINKYLIRGPKEWMSATPLISLYTLIIRSGWFRAFSKVKQVEDIAPICEKIIDATCSVEKIRQHIRLVEESYKYWLLLVLNEKELFDKRTPVTIYGRNNEHSGIAKLISLSHDIDVTTRKCWERLVKEYKK